MTDTHTWQDGRPDWHSGEVRLWIMNDEHPYNTMLRCASVSDAQELFDGMPGPNVDWERVDWSWVYHAFDDDREDMEVHEP